MHEGPAQGSLATIEPDLAGAVHFHDATYELKLEPRGSDVLLTVQARNDANGGR